MDENIVETLELIRTFYNSFMETNGAEDIDKAIGLAEGLVVGSASWAITGVNLLLSHLRQVRSEVIHPSTGGLNLEISHGGSTHPKGDRSARGLALMGQMFCKLFQQSRAVKYLDKAIGLFEEALSMSSTEDQNRAREVSNLSVCYGERYNLLGNMKDLNMAIERLEEGAAATPLDYPGRGAMLKNLGYLLCTRFECLGALGDLDIAIERLQEALAATSLDDPDRVVMLITVGELLDTRFGRLGALANLDMAIKRQREAVTATPPDHPDRAAVLNNLVILLNTRFGRLGALADLELAIEQLQEALAAAPPDHPHRAEMLNNLGNLLDTRFERLGGPEDFLIAIPRLQEALAATPLDHPHRAVMLSNLGTLLDTRFRRLGALVDLDMAIKHLQEAVAAIPPDHPHRAGMLGNLGNLLDTRFRRLGALADLDMAIERLQEAFAAIPLDHPDRATILNGLGNLLGLRFGRLGALADLDMAIERQQEALAATPPSHPHRAGMLGNLGNLLGMRFGRLEAQADLDMAIEQLQEAVAATPPDHPGRAWVLSSLGSFLDTRSKHLISLADLDIDLERPQEAVVVALPNHPGRTGMSNNLGALLDTRSKRPRALADLDMAIERLQEAVAAAPPNFPGRVGMSKKLGALLDTRSKHLRALADLDMAIERLQEAVAAAPSDHPDRAELLQHMASCFHNRYLIRRETEDIEKAIELAEEAVSLVPSDHLRYGLALVELASLVYGKGSPDAQSLSYIHDLSLKAWNSTIAPPNIRVMAAVLLSDTLTQQEVWGGAFSILEDAVELLPTVSPQSLCRDDQQYRLSGFTHLASEAVSLGLQAGETASRCLRIFELGRGIIMGFSIDCRSTGNLVGLREMQPEVYKRFNDLRARVDSSTSTNTKTISYFRPGGKEVTYEDSRRQRLKDIQELAEALDSIRAIPEFEGYQLPPSAEGLMEIAKEGPIVVINCTNLRSDAIIVTNLAIDVLPLPTLIFQDANEKMKYLNTKVIRGRQSSYRSRNEKMEELLLWLWDVVVGPVFEKLKLSPIVGPAHDCSKLPRVWWIGVGILSMAPFHAAGNHSPDSTQNAISCAVSIYISTIKALSYAREKHVRLLEEDSKLLLVAMPESLRTANKEVSTIRSLVPEATITQQLDTPSANTILQTILLYDAIHFTCHGVSDSQNPSGSHLVLGKDEGSAPGAEKLTAGAISNINNQRAQIAYLSACSTAQNTSVNLADESIHIASAFQLVGFSHVIANMWKAKDEACQEVSTEFYRLLFDGGPPGSDGGHRKVSTAVHLAVKKLRDNNWKEPLLWVPFIHTGA